MSEHESISIIDWDSERMYIISVVCVWVCLRQSQKTQLCVWVHWVGTDPILSDLGITTSWPAAGHAHIHQHTQIEQWDIDEGGREGGEESSKGNNKRHGRRFRIIHSKWVHSWLSCYAEHFHLKKLCKMYSKALLKKMLHTKKERISKCFVFSPLPSCFLCPDPSFPLSRSCSGPSV